VCSPIAEKHETPENAIKQKEAEEQLTSRLLAFLLEKVFDMEYFGGVFELATGGKAIEAMAFKKLDPKNWTQKLGPKN
jgi:hypothetical protein